MIRKQPDATFLLAFLGFISIALGALIHVLKPYQEPPDTHPRLASERPAPRLVAATLLGGSQREQIRGVAIAPDGRIYATGRSESPRLPTTKGAYQRRFGGGGMDAFVACYSPDLKTLHWLSYFGGRGYEVGYGIGLAPDGSVVIAGRTSSDDLPTTKGVVGERYSGGRKDEKPYHGGDAFVARLSADGSSLLMCSYLGGSDDDFARHVSVDPVSGRIALGGSTRSRDFPATKSKFGGRHHGGDFDAFAAVLDSGATQLAYCGCIGGGWNDRGQGLVLRGDELQIAGWTNSPRIVGMPQGGAPKTTDAWVARIAVAEGRLVASRRIGGAGEESPEQGSLSLAGDRLLLGGYRAADAFPGPWNDGGKGGGIDAFVALLRRSDLEFLAGLRIGGRRGETVFGPAALTKDGTIWACGDTNSSDFPLAKGLPGLRRGDPKQAFVTVLAPNGGALLSARLFGGSRVDTARGCMPTPRGGVIVYGQTTSSDFPVSEGAAQLRHGGRIDGFLAHFR